MRFFVTHCYNRRHSRENGVSLAATNFSLNLINSNAFERIYAVLPTFVKGKLEKSKYKGAIKEESQTIIPIYSAVVRNSPFRKIAILKEQFDLFWKIPKQSSVWLYNLCAANILLVKLLQIFKPSVKIFSIVLDFTPDDPANKKYLKLINSCPGRIVLSPSTLFNQKNTICLPGVVANTKFQTSKIKEIGFDFLLSGTLSDNISMLSQLLDVFKELPNARLHITGKAPAKAQDYAAKYPNIICYGVIPFEQYTKILDSVTFVLSTRDPSFPENNCNFPSKIIEGLMHNRIILSTIDYPQLSPIKYIKIDANHLSDEIAQNLSTPVEDLLEYANQSELTFEKFNVEVWHKAIQQIEENT